MTYEQFKAELFQYVRKHILNGESLRWNSIYRNNGIVLDGMSIYQCNPDIHQTICLQDLYAEFNRHGNFALICSHAINLLNAIIPEEIQKMAHLGFHKMENGITFRLINYEKNKSMLQKIPFRPFLDLAMVFCYMLKMKDGQYASIIVQNSHLKEWKITADKVYQCACSNTPSLFPVKFQPLDDIIAPFFNETTSYKNTGLHVLTNCDTLYGAGCIAYDGVLEKISDGFDSDVIVLPSSVHEVLLLPKMTGINTSELLGIVRVVNETEVKDTEVLSDNVYVYSRKEKDLCVSLV